MAGLLVAGTAQAQSGMVQAIRPPSTENLNRHLSRLASNPRDVDALIGAGEAAIDLDDTRAAAGFFARADMIQPNNGRVKAGLGRVMLKTQNPTEALRMFDQATKLGYPEATLLSDRGLARDLTGDQAGAQRDYQAALKHTPDNTELTYRYAASLGISGQVEAADKVLQPLLHKSDRPAWRFRAFILAMNNRQDDARKIASQTMPAQLAAAITPYMVKMPYLTAAQKAAAVHFGHFPTTVGSTVAAVAPTPAPATPSAVAPSQAAPAPVVAAPRQTRAQRRSAGRTTLARADNRAAPSASVQTRAATTSATTPVEPGEQTRPTSPPAAAPSATMRPTAPPPAAPPPTATPARPSVSGTAQVQGPPAPGFESLSARPSTPPSAPLAATPAPTQAPAQAAQPAAIQPAPVQSAPAQAATPPTPTPTTPQPDPAATRTLADIIRTIDVPDSERRPTVAAVDLAEVAALQAARRAEQQAAAEEVKKTALAAKAKAAAAAKLKAEADAKAKKAAEEKARLAANPSRNWVQLGVGSNRGALAFTLKNLRRKYDDVAPQDGWVANWGRTNRLLIGPFASFTRAKAVESKLKGAGADAFAWQSEAGELVERLTTK